MIPAIYHLEAKVITRGVGRSAVAASAYMSCSEITNEYNGVKHDYTKKGSLVYEKIFLPSHAPPEYYRGVQVEANLLPKIQIDIVVSKVPVRTVIETAKKVLYTGHIGDGKIFVYDVENVVKVRTGEEGYDALQDVE